MNEIQFRPITPDDIPLIGTYILAEPSHKEKMDSRFYTELPANSVSYAVDDDEGTVAFVRQDSLPGNTMRLHTDFVPDSKERIAAAISMAYPMIALDAYAKGFDRIVFESESVPLIAFMLRMGFRAQLIHELPTA